MELLVRQEEYVHRDYVDGHRLVVSLEITFGSFFFFGLFF
jgi:hypothetical protein